ncbi:MAG: hypothetical protein BGO34_10890 [Bacteroidia bacterium 44-10]|nr:MAG: hypothetical protein BGO34_10890 [Bacteroidia bacterium 44-10]
MICGLVCVINVKAEGTISPAKTAEPVTVNIKLSPIQAIVVNAGQKTVDLEYTTITDYEQGVTKALANHLTVYSAGKFGVYVKTNGNFMNGSESIGARDVTVKATHSGHSVGTFTPVGLTTADQLLISSTSKGGNGLKYNIEYDNLDGKDFKYAGEAYYTAASGVLTYTAEVTYTILPD